MYLEKPISMFINPFPNGFRHRFEFKVSVREFGLDHRMKVILENIEEGGLASSNVTLKHDQDGALSKGTIPVGHSEGSTSGHRHFL